MIKLQENVMCGAARGAWLVAALLSMATVGCGDAQGVATTGDENLGTVSEDLLVENFSDFAQIEGGNWDFAPAVTRTGGGQVNVFMVGTDDQIHRRVVGGALTALPPLDEGVHSRVSATSRGSNRWVAVKGHDDKLYVSFNSGAWAAISTLLFDSAPAIISEPTATGSFLTIVARGHDNLLHYATNLVNPDYDPENWSGFNPIPGGSGFTRDPAGVNQGVNCFPCGTALTRVVAQAGNGLWTTARAPGGVWGSWKKVPVSNGFTQTSSPAVSSFGGAHIDIFARGGDNRIWFNSQEPDLTWAGWQAIPNFTSTSSPAAWSTISTSQSLIHVVAKGTNETISQSVYTP